MEDSENVLGKMILSSDGAILQSSGSLENNERTATIINKAIAIVNSYTPQLYDEEGEKAGNKTDATSGPSGSSVTSMTSGGSSGDKKAFLSEVKYRKISFIYLNRAYVVVRSGNKVYVVNKRVTEAPSIEELIQQQEQ